MASTRSGRPPTPPALRSLKGGKSHHGPEKPCPTPDPTAPDPPDWLDEEARAEWDRMAPQLAELGLLTAIDGMALAAYCLAVSTLIAARKIIADHYAKTGKLTRIYKNKFGAENETAIPEVAIARDAMATIRAFCSEFGMTPSSRGRMRGLGDGQKPGKLTDYVNRRPAQAGEDKA